VEKVFVNTFYDLVKNVSGQSGFELDTDIEAYVVFFLAEYVRKRGFPPEKAFALTLANINKTNKRVPDSKYLAEDCLFLTSFCPTYAYQKGMSLKYYTQLGANCYFDYADATKDSFFYRVGDAFEFLRDFIEQILNSSPVRLDQLIWLAENGSYTAKQKLPKGMIFLRDRVNRS
jgi:hypothetical protein